MAKGPQNLLDGESTLPPLWQINFAICRAMHCHNESSRLVTNTIDSYTANLIIFHVSSFKYPEKLKVILKIILPHVLCMFIFFLYYCIYISNFKFSACQVQFVLADELREYPAIYF